jgi:CTP:molybdopterin cytidylyltransferase MocA
VIAGVILAAGASSRMGRPKAALPLGARGDTVLSRGVRTLLEAGVPSVAVVSGAAPEAVRAALGRRSRRVRIVHHPGWAAGQLSSLLAALDAVDDPSLEALLVTLVDVPLVAPDTVRQVIRAWRDTRAPIVRPAIGDRHGHPVIFDRAVFGDLRSADPSMGAKAVVRAYESRIVNVPVTDEGAFVDLDTPEDYQRWNS